MNEAQGKAQYGMEYKLGELAEEVRGLNQWLRGNGKMGVIGELRTDVDNLKQQRTEHDIRQKTLKWGFNAVGGLLIWAWGVILGSSSWLPKLHDFLRAMGW